MKHKKLFTFFLLSFIFTYGFFSFVVWDFDIKNWGPIVRTMFGLANLPILIMIGISFKKP